MKKTDFTNMVIAQSGGPSMVINQSLVGAVLAARAPRVGARIGRILGARHGIAGILGRDYVDLRKVDEGKLRAIAETPSAALGSCRLKPTADDCRRIFSAFKRLKVGFVFYIGGNDSADAARIVAEEAEKDGYPLVCYHIPKTIDNDLRSCDHTPGFGSAARFVASAFKGDDLDNRALGGVKIDVVMGRDAGFLTAASALARVRRDDGPHLIYLPERPFSLDGFVADVQAAMKKFGRCVVAVSEGIRDESGASIGAQFARKDAAVQQQRDVRVVINVQFCLCRRYARGQFLARRANQFHRANLRGAQGDLARCRSDARMLPFEGGKLAVRFQRYAALGDNIL